MTQPAFDAGLNERGNSRDAHLAATSVESVTLVKRNDGFGNAPKGETYTARFKHPMERDLAVVLAYKMLKRDRISENPMAWDVAA